MKNKNKKPESSGMQGERYNKAASALESRIVKLVNDGLFNQAMSFETATQRMNILHGMLLHHLEQIERLLVDLYIVELVKEESEGDVDNKVTQLYRSQKISEMNAEQLEAMKDALRISIRQNNRATLELDTGPTLAP